MKIRPNGERVAIKPMAVAEKSVGGIIIPDTAQEKPLIGQIVAIGEIDMEKNHLVVGDMVLYSKFGCTEVKIDLDVFLICKADDVLCVLED